MTIIKKIYKKFNKMFFKFRDKKKKIILSNKIKDKNRILNMKSIQLSKNQNKLKFYLILNIERYFQNRMLGKHK